MFYGFDAEQKSRECHEKLDTYILINYDALTDRFLDQFERYCRRIAAMQKAGKKDAIGFIHLSILRTNILDKRHIIRLDAYDENWYADRTECSGEYDASEFLIWLDEFSDALESAAQPLYIPERLKDVQSRIFEESNKYLVIVAEFVRMALLKAVEKEWFRNVRRCAIFAICIGGYQDKCDILYKEDSTVKDSQNVKRHLERNLPVYTHEICKQLDLSDGKYKDIRLLFSNFSGCDFSGSSFENAVIISGDFKQTVIRNVNMRKAQIVDTNFNGAVMENVDFQSAMLKHVSFAGAALTNVTFEGTLLAEDLDFDEATLLNTTIPARIPATTS